MSCYFFLNFHSFIDWNSIKVSRSASLGYLKRSIENLEEGEEDYCKHRRNMEWSGKLTRRYSQESLEKTLMLEKIEGKRRRKWQDEMAGWHHRLNRCEFEQTLGDSEGKVSLVWYSTWGHKELDMTEQLDNSNIPFTTHSFICGFIHFLTRLFTGHK